MLMRVSEELNWATTEARNPRSMEIDRFTSAEIVALILEEEQHVFAGIQTELPKIVQLVDVVVERVRRGGRLIYVGAGTSGRLAMLDSVESVPTFGLQIGEIVAVIAEGPAALSTAVEAVEDDEEAGWRALEGINVCPADVVLGISASGRTPYVRGAMQAARQHRAYVAALVCNLPSPLAALADLTIALLVGPEVIAGSTRMKAWNCAKDRAYDSQHNRDDPSWQDLW